MNPLSLLNKGQTVKGFKDRSCTYRLTTKGFAPNFSSAKNPPPTVSHREPEASQATLFDQGKSPAVAPPVAPAPKPPVRAPQPVSCPTPWNRLAGFCRHFLGRWTAHRKASPFQGPIVQTELALDKVTVVRNELLDDDLEVVPVGKKVKPVQHDQCQAIPTDQ